MKIDKTDIPGVIIVEMDEISDERGRFLKTFQKEIFCEMNLECGFEELFYSISREKVIRGMHFQVPPYDCSKLVYVPSGLILDVILDVRKDSITFAKYLSIELSGSNRRSVYIPKGCAHGFLSLENNTNVTYLQTKIHMSGFDLGIRWDSFGMNWPVNNPVVSKRDQQFVNFKDYDSPFVKE